MMAAALVSVEDLIARTLSTRAIADASVARIRATTGRMRILALNAMIEATQAGDAGRGFAVVAQEVRGISTEVETLSGTLSHELRTEIAGLETLARRMAADSRGARLMDLALNAVELIDRNLYERTCDVRWWATDSAVVEAVETALPERRTHAARRLGVILDAYTVYLDLWLCDMNGRVVANGRPDRWSVAGLDVSDRAWFRRGRDLANGNDFAVADITTEPHLGGAQIATYAASVRAGGEAGGRPVGVLGIHFDWEPQARAIVEGVRLGDGEKARTRVLLVDSANRVLAASDGHGILTERFPLKTSGRSCGFDVEPSGRVVAFHHTPGYETYKGLGWHGVIVQTG